MKAIELKSMNTEKAALAVVAEYERLTKARSISTKIGRAKIVEELRNLWIVAGKDPTQFPLARNAAKAAKLGIDAARERGLKK